MRPDLSFLGKAGFHKDTSPAPSSPTVVAVRSRTGRQSSPRAQTGGSGEAKPGRPRAAGERRRALPEPQEAGAGRGPGGGSC